MRTTENLAGKTFEDLLRVVETLRDPGGCPWDAEQTHESLRSHLLEETYETLEAIETGEPAKLAEELGDLLIQVTFHIDIAARAGDFDSEEVISGVIDKLIRRHPHVFGGGRQMQDADEVLEQWEDIKRREKGRSSIVESLPVSMPALSYAAAVMGRAAKAGVPIENMAPTVNDGEVALDSESDAGRYLMGVARGVEEAGHDPETALRSYGLELRNRIIRAEKAVEPRTLSELSADEMRTVVGASGRLGASQGVIAMLPGSPSVTSPMTAA